MATTYTTLQFLTALQAGTRESPITIFDGDGEFLGYLAEDTPVPKAAASGTITFSDVVYDGETVTIGSDVYELDVDASVSAGNITVDISGGTKTQASAIITASDVLVDGETITIGSDVFEIDSDGSVGSGNIAVDISGNTTAASGTLTFTGVVSDGEIVVIGNDTYEFDTNDTLSDESHIRVDVGSNTAASEAVVALAAAISSASTEHVDAAADTGAGTVVVTHDVPGSAGNSIATTTDCANASWGAATLEGGADASNLQCLAALETAITNSATEEVTGTDNADGTLTVEATAAGVLDGSAGNSVAVSTDAVNASWGTATLEGGSDATAIEAGAALTSAINTSGTEAVTAVDGGDGSVAVEADTEGSAGNSIATTTDALNGAWGAATLEGGADGSTGTKGEVRYDSSYMYICVENTTDGSGWKKLSLSSL